MANQRVIRARFERTLLGINGMEHPFEAAITANLYLSNSASSFFDDRDEHIVRMDHRIQLLVRLTVGRWMIG
jgi:hypothetical protein